MRCDARTEIEGDAVQVIAFARRTLLAAFPEAVEMRIAEIPAARALREIAADRRKVPDLRRREPAGRSREPRIRTKDLCVRCERRNAGGRADAGGAAVVPADADCI